MMGISGGSMNALLTAGARMEQASMQGRVANNVRANANILRAEIKQDAGRGASVEKKENALKEMEEKGEKPLYDFYAETLVDAAEYILDRENHVRHF